MFNHFDEAGKAIMVDVGEKAASERIAVSHGYISMSGTCFSMVKEGNTKKGDVLGVARIAGIMAVKKTYETIPLCHILLLTHAKIDFVLDEQGQRIEVICTVKTKGNTGVEMEALHGTSIALLTIYDMCKAEDRSMMITEISLLKKDGGKSGLYERDR